jgi:crotonobetainyl-CoA:carnitine CoA-transferase CaiB-like acyl-CoA transferase
VEAASGLRVLEVGERLGTASAGLALAALGAQVAQLRLPGRRVPPVESAYYDRGRLTLSAGSAGVSELRAIAQGCDLILSDLDERRLAGMGLPGGPDDLARRDRPDHSQILVSIRPLGRSGPSSGFRMTDLTEWASSGLATVTRRPFPRDPARYAPVLPPGFQPQAIAGLAAAAGAFAAIRWSRESGQPVVVDVSVQEVLAATLHNIFPNFVWNNQILGHPSTPNNAIGLLLPASDGDVYIRTVESHQWEKLMEWVGRPEWRSLGDDPSLRLANLDALTVLMSEWSSTHGREDLLIEGQRRRVPVALPRSIQDVLLWQHLRARGAWRDIEVEGQRGEVGRIPIIEPPTWAPLSELDPAELVDRWAPR